MPKDALVYDTSDLDVDPPSPAIRHFSVKDRYFAIFFTRAFELLAGLNQYYMIENLHTSEGTVLSTFNRVLALPNPG
ncbi:hypothetical protein PMI40_04639 [Herbaspirillum sp. YR522]|nr:hypothetical protein PMI40_04639 [Herbaspirillum sp. YR522]